MKKGIKIGNYVLVELLSAGGMGQVWLARRTFEEGGTISVAIKFLHASGVLDARLRAALNAEGRLGMRLQHPNIPRVIDMGVHEGLPYIVMDFIAGRSLHELLVRRRDKRRPLPLPVVAHIAREIGYALKYAHELEIDGEHQRLIHRDVAPKNVLVSGHGGVYVIDFGIAEALSLETSKNCIKGTLLYMAPEHALGFPTQRSDAWGVGTILYEMIENRKFRGDVEGDQLRHSANQGYAPPLTRDGLPGVLRFITEGLLRPDQYGRLTIDEMLSNLESPEFPPQRLEVWGIMDLEFGPSVRRTGHTKHELEIPEQLQQIERTLAAARVVVSQGIQPDEDRPLDEEGAPERPEQDDGRPGGTRPMQRMRSVDNDDDDPCRPSSDESTEDELPLAPEPAAAPSEPDPTIVLRVPPQAAAGVPATVRLASPHEASVRVRRLLPAATELHEPPESRRLSAPAPLAEPAVMPRPVARTELAPAAPGVIAASERAITDVAAAPSAPHPSAGPRPSWLGIVILVIATVGVLGIGVGSWVVATRDVEPARSVAAGTVEPIERTAPEPEQQPDVVPSPPPAARPQLAPAKAEPEPPQVEADSPEVEADSPEVEADSPEAVPEPPKVEPEAPEVEPKPPKAEPKLPEPQRAASTPKATVPRVTVHVRLDMADGDVELRVGRGKPIRISGDKTLAVKATTTSMAVRVPGSSTWYSSTVTIDAAKTYLLRLTATNLKLIPL